MSRLARTPVPTFPFLDGLLPADRPRASLWEDPAHPALFALSQVSATTTPAPSRMSERQATRRRGKRVPPCADGTRSPICEALDRPSQVPQSSPSWPRPQALAPSAGPSVIARKARDRPYPRSHNGGPDDGHPGLRRSALSRRVIARAEVSAYLLRDETRPRDRGPTAFRRRVERAACSQAPDCVCS